MSMLSAFTAQPIIEFKQRDKSKVESVLTHGDRLFVGLNTGSLRIYRISEGQDSTKSIELLREQEKFSKYKIEQLAIIKEAGTLVALSGAAVSTYDVSSYEPQETFARSRGATTFAVTSNIVKDQDIPLIVSRLAVAVKRKLFLWTWQDSDLINEDHEIMLASGIKTLTWATASKLVVGLTSSYVVVDVENNEVKDIVGPGSIGGASAPEGRLGVASLGYMGMGGMIPKPLATRLADGEILLAKDINTHFINASGESLDRRQIPWSTAPEAIGYSYPFLLSLTKGSLEIRNPHTLTMLQSIALPSATQLYVPNPHISLAHAGKGFLVASERCIWRMDALGYDAQIDALVDNKRYDEALSLLGSLEFALVADKEGRLREIKMLKGQELFSHRRYRESMDLFIEAHAPPERVILLYPAIVSGNVGQDPKVEEASKPEVEEDSPKAEDVPKHTAPPIRGHTRDTSVEVDPSSKSILSSVSSDDGESILSTVASVLASRRELEGKELLVATSELCSFLADTRRMLQHFITFDGQLKETSVVVNGDEVQASDLLLYPSDLEEGLRTVFKIVDTTLFRAYMLAKPSMAGPLFRLPNYCDAAVVKEKLLESKRYNDIIDFLYGKKLHKEALDLLKELEPQRTVAYLQNLTNIDLILEYARWVMEQDPELGVEVFLADIENAEGLDRKKVLAFLRDFGLAGRYLEHIVELGDETPEFHNELVKEYSGDKLLSFLKTSKHYQSWKVLPLLSRSDPEVYEARAIILGNMGEHRQALSIYVFDMKSPEKAEEYCNQVYMKNESVYGILLSLYLPAQLEPALDLLAKHGSRLPAESTLELLPDVSVSRLEDYFTGRIRANNSMVAQGRIVAGLRKSLDFMIESKVRGARDRGVVITEERVCGVCHKRFGGSAIKVMPDNAVIHYNCGAR